MKVLKKTAEYTVFQKRSGRYAVLDANKKAVNGDDKVAILVAEGYVKQPEPKVGEAPVEEVAEAAEEAEATAEEPAEEAAAEEEEPKAE